jgi:hypothetical protein
LEDNIRIDLLKKYVSIRTTIELVKNIYWIAALVHEVFDLRVS